PYHCRAEGESCSQRTVETGLFQQPVKGDFPRDAGFWSERVQQAVTAAERELSERTDGEVSTFAAAGWWREDVDLHPANRATFGGGATEPPAPMERKNILEEIGTRHLGLAPRIERLMQAHRRYADKTGDVFFLVRTACNVGMRLIKSGDDSECRARGMQAVTLARLAFEYDPVNVFAWSPGQSPEQAEDSQTALRVIHW
ncbi:MAG: hypothetical protein ACK5PT_16025, partial [Cereibacter sp.]